MGSIITRMENIFNIQPR